MEQKGGIDGRGRIEREQTESRERAERERTERRERHAGRDGWREGGRG